MKVLSVGSMKGISNTCLHRNMALKKIADEVDVVNTAWPLSLWYRITYHIFLLGIPIRIPDEANANQMILKLVENNQYDVVWIDKGITITPETLQHIKKKNPSTTIVSYSPDNMALRHNQSQQYLDCVPLYDYIITTKSYILDDMKRLGAQNVIFVNNAYEKTFHKYYDLTDSDKERLKANVAFVGSFEKDRCESIIYLVNHGIRVTLWGSGRHWKKYKNYSDNLILHEGGLYSEDYGKSFQASKISLCFLKKMNKDLQTTRTMEIPACGGFMLAERTDEHMQLFEEDKEAVFFSSNEELLEKCRYYLEHDEERKAIAKAGHRRCIESDYSNEGMIMKVLNEIGVIK